MLNVLKNNATTQERNIRLWPAVALLIFDEASMSKHRLHFV